MTASVMQQIGAVRRTVGTRVREAGEARVVTVSQVYDAPVGEVWDACTSAERIPRWFLPITGDLRLGGRYQLEGNAGGVVEACDPPGGATVPGFVATWEFGGEVTWIEVRLTAEDGATRFTLDHVGHVKDEFWQEFGPGAVGVGWDSALLGLAGHFGAAPRIDPADGTAWLASEEGRGS